MFNDIQRDSGERVENKKLVKSAVVNRFWLFELILMVDYRARDPHKSTTIEPSENLELLS